MKLNSSLVSKGKMKGQQNEKETNPRQARALRALMNNTQMCENLDGIAGCSNSPELVASLRRQGLEIPCDRVERFDRDGNACYPGLYQ